MTVRKTNCGECKEKLTVVTVRKNNPSAAAAAAAFADLRVSFSVKVEEVRRRVVDATKGAAEIVEKDA